jgi:hypothetical protein
MQYQPVTQVEEMKEQRDQPIKVSTCFEGLTGAEMMQKISCEEGAGSPCEEIMRSLIEGRSRGRGSPEKAKKKEAAEEENSQKNETAPDKNENHKQEE